MKVYCAQRERRRDMGMTAATTPGRQTRRSNRQRSHADLCSLSFRNPRNPRDDPRPWLAWRARKANLCCCSCITIGLHLTAVQHPAQRLSTPLNPGRNACPCCESQMLPSSSSCCKGADMGPASARRVQVCQCFPRCSRKWAWGIAWWNCSSQRSAMWGHLLGANLSALKTNNRAIVPSGFWLCFRYVD
ncbi:hypothetical protein F5144DRAFT_354010 [Chaetomium tenue]|uniref:Uncharacterized protein n=1 Tax=Chaetomium tenue TaxID=1854479 RepID=A0ACB7NZU6_9PEZI|nr:hypothetical protein F5144DRAFT_354010 [Chaetomium globosum]